MFSFQQKKSTLTPETTTPFFTGTKQAKDGSTTKLSIENSVLSPLNSSSPQIYPIFSAGKHKKSKSDDPTKKGGLFPTSQFTRSPSTPQFSKEQQASFMPSSTEGDIPASLFPIARIGGYRERTKSDGVSYCKPSPSDIPSPLTSPLHILGRTPSIDDENNTGLKISSPSMGWLGKKLIKRHSKSSLTDIINVDDTINSSVNSFSSTPLQMSVLSIPEEGPQKHSISISPSFKNIFKLSKMHKNSSRIFNSLEAPIGSTNQNEASFPCIPSIPDEPSISDQNDLGNSFKAVSLNMLNNLVISERVKVASGSVDIKNRSDEMLNLFASELGVDIISECNNTWGSNSGESQSSKGTRTGSGGSAVHKRKESITNKISTKASSLLEQESLKSLSTCITTTNDEKKKSSSSWMSNVFHKSPRTPKIHGDKSKLCFEKIQFLLATPDNQKEIFYLKGPRSIKEMRDEIFKFCGIDENDQRGYILSTDGDLDSDFKDETVDDDQLLEYILSCHEKGTASIQLKISLCVNKNSSLFEKKKTSEFQSEFSKSFKKTNINRERPCSAPSSGRRTSNQSKIKESQLHRLDSSNNSSRSSFQIINPTSGAASDVIRPGYDDIISHLDLFFPDINKLDDDSNSVFGKLDDSVGSGENLSVNTTSSNSIRLSYSSISNLNSTSNLKMPYLSNNSSSNNPNQSNSTLPMRRELLKNKVKGVDLLRSSFSSYHILVDKQPSNLSQSLNYSVNPGQRFITDSSSTVSSELVHTSSQSSTKNSSIKDFVIAAAETKRETNIKRKELVFGNNKKPTAHHNQVKIAPLNSNHQFQFELDPPDYILNESDSASVISLSIAPSIKSSDSIKRIRKPLPNLSTLGIPPSYDSPVSAAEPVSLFWAALKGERKEDNSNLKYTQPPEEIVQLDLEMEKLPIMWYQGDLIGSGAFGKVFLGLNFQTWELMAVKQVEVSALKNRSKQNSETLSPEDSMLIEISLLKSLDHINVVCYIDCEITSNLINIFLEYVPGGSIQSILSRSGPFPEKLVQVFSLQVLVGLEYLHKMGVVHRDIKAANILVDLEGIVKITDFGVSKQLIIGSEDDASYNLRSSLISVRGTANWMAPEVIKREGYNAKVDIWSFGCLMVEMLSGLKPWKQYDNDFQVFSQLGKKKLPSIPKGISAEAEFMLSLCFQYEINARPTATQLLENSYVKGISPLDTSFFDFQSFLKKADDDFKRRKKEEKEKEIESDSDYSDDFEYSEVEEDKDLDEAQKVSNDEMDNEKLTGNISGSCK